MGSHEDELAVVEGKCYIIVAGLGRGRGKTKPTTTKEKKKSTITKTYFKRAKFKKKNTTKKTTKPSKMETSEGLTF